MQHSSVDSSNLVVEHPACEQCGTPMSLTRLEPDKSNHDKRTFECKGCGASKVEIVKYREGGRRYFLNQRFVTGSLPSPSSAKFAVDDFDDNTRAQANIDRGDGP